MDVINRLFKLSINRDLLKKRCSDYCKIYSLPDYVIVCANDEEEARSLKELDNAKWGKLPDPKSEATLVTGGKDTPDERVLWENRNFVSCSEYHDDTLVCQGKGIYDYRE